MRRNSYIWHLAKVVETREGGRDHLYLLYICKIYIKLYRHKVLYSKYLEHYINNYYFSIHIVSFSKLVSYTVYLIQL